MTFAWALPSGGFGRRFLRQLQPLPNRFEVFPGMAKIWQITSSGCEWMDHPSETGLSPPVSILTNLRDGRCRLTVNRASR
jgi:hypothetical protein